MWLITKNIKNKIRIIELEGAYRLQKKRKNIVRNEDFILYHKNRQLRWYGYVERIEDADREIEKNYTKAEKGRTTTHQMENTNRFRNE